MQRSQFLSESQCWMHICTVGCISIQFDALLYNWMQFSTIWCISLQKSQLNKWRLQQYFRWAKNSEFYDIWCFFEILINANLLCNGVLYICQKCFSMFELLFWQKILVFLLPIYVTLSWFLQTMQNLFSEENISLLFSFPASKHACACVAGFILDH